MNVLVFIGGMAIGACITAIAGLLWEMRETRLDLGVIRRHAERARAAELKRAEALVERYETGRARREAAPWN